MIAEPECKVCRRPTAILVNEREGTAICRACGSVVLTQDINVTAEWRSFESGSTDRNRVGLVRDNGELMGLVISGGSSRLKSSSQLMESYDQSLSDMKVQIERICSLLNFQMKFVRRAKEILEEAHSKMKSFKGHSIYAIAGAVVIIATKQMSIPLKPHDVEGVAGVEIKKIHTSYKMIKNVLNPELIEKPKMTEAMSYAEKFCDQNGILGLSRKKILGGVKKIEEMRVLDGKRPSTVAHSIMYILAKKNDGLDMKMLLEKCGTSEKTLRGVHRELERHENEIVSAMNQIC
jgi:transcription initiation factor TFIIIB Brf1 subunit/transcription initiation factor TFIIB